VRHPLHTSADFILALDYEDSVRLQDPLGFDCCLNIQLQHRVVPLALESIRAVAVRIVVAERRMGAVSCEGLVASEQALHVRRVQNKAVYRAPRIWELAAVGTRPQVSRQQGILVGRDIPPEDALPIRNVGHLRPSWHVQTKHPREDVGIVSGVGGEHQVGCRLSGRRLSPRFHVAIVHNPNARASVFLAVVPASFCPQRRPLGQLRV
jgi:hypothetical protein